MRASRVAQFLRSVGVSVMSCAEGDDLVDGLVVISQDVRVQVATVGSDCRVVRFVPGSQREYPYRETLDALLVDVRDAVWHAGTDYLGVAGL